MHTARLFQSGARSDSAMTLLVTHNTREFSKVPGLQLDNWVADL